MSEDVEIQTACTIITGNGSEGAQEIELKQALVEAGFHRLQTVALSELGQRLISPSAFDISECLLINPFDPIIQDPFHEIWDLRNHYLLPVILYGFEQASSREKSEAFTRVKNLFRSLDYPYSVSQIRQEIQQANSYMEEMNAIFSSSPWLIASMNAVDEGIIISDAMNRVRYVNLAAERLIELPIIELYHSQIEDVVVLGNIQTSQHRNGGLSLIEQADLMRTDGSVIPVEVQQNVVYSNKKHVIGSITLLRDQRKLAQFTSSMREANQQEELHARTRSEFISNMSHELRTPLNSILGMADLAMELAQEDEQREFLSLLKSSTRNLSSLVNTILDYAKLEAHNLTLEYERFHIYGLLEKTIAQYINRAHGKNLRFYAEIQPGMRSIYRGDKERIAEVLENLVQNAVKFTRTGFVRCSISEKDAPDATTLTDIRQPVELIIEVSDSGRGIPPADHENIFEPFFQVDATATRSFGGTGLGLSIAKRLAMRMGGDVTLVSNPGEGSVFTARMLVNREDSDLLFLNKKLIGDSVVSDRIPEYIRDLLKSNTFYFISEDGMWSANIRRWLGYVGLSFRELGSYSLCTSLSSEQLKSGIFIHDLRVSWAEELGNYFYSRAQQGELSRGHIISRVPNLPPGSQLSHWLPKCEWISEPMQVHQFFDAALRSLQGKQIAGSNVDEDSHLNRLCILTTTEALQEMPELVGQVIDEAGKRSIEVCEIQPGKNVRELTAFLPDAILAFDESFGAGPTLSLDSNVDQAIELIEESRKLSSHICPVFVVLDSAAPSAVIQHRVSAYMRRGFVTIPIVNYSATELINRLDAELRGAAASGQVQQTGLRSMLDRLGTAAVDGDFTTIEQLAGEFQNECKRYEHYQAANDLFRILLASRRADRETIFDILNTMRNDADKNSNS